MHTALLIIGLLCLAVGIVGSVLPGLPGPPLAWVGLLLASVSTYAPCGTAMIVATAVVALVITLLDYVVPSTSTKRYGGSNYGVWGCNIGLVLSVIGLPFGPQGIVGMVLWPFVGAFVGEVIKSRHAATALRAAWGAFMGFLTGTLLKLIYCLAVAVIVVVKWL